MNTEKSTMPLASILYYIFCDLSTVFWRGKVTPPARTTSKNRGGAQMEQLTAPTTTATPRANHNGKGKAQLRKKHGAQAKQTPQNTIRARTRTHAHAKASHHAAEK